MSEELLAELSALAKLIDRLDHEIERLRRQFDRTEKAVRWEVGVEPRPLWSREDDDGSN